MARGARTAEREGRARAQVAAVQTLGVWQRSRGITGAMTATRMARWVVGGTPGSVSGLRPMGR